MHITVWSPITMESTRNHQATYEYMQKQALHTDDGEIHKRLW